MTVVLSSIVAGSERPGPRRSQDLNPAFPGEVVAEILPADASVAEAAVQAAAQAFPGWAGTPAPARGEILRRAADLLDDRTPQIARDLTREEGKTLAEAMGETQRAVAILRYYAGQTLEPIGDVYPSHSAHTFLFARREPLGVIVAITPWNFPIAIPAWKIAPALAYGNTVVWKPAELVPLTATHFVRTLDEAGLPPGVLNLVLGKGSDVGDALTTSPHTAAVTFTGSNAVGAQLQARATAPGRKVHLELGGKNPTVVLDDADLALAAAQIAKGGFQSAGQKCTATSRVIAQRSVFEDVCDRLVAECEKWRLGDPLDPHTTLGPLASAEQLETVLGYLDLARSEGSSVLAGGNRAAELGAGHFVRPTVLRDVDPSSRLLREEIFGPVLSVQLADNFDEAIRMANDTHFGLSAAVFTRDLDRALRFAAEIKAGVVKVNQETAGIEHHVPFGGQGASSSGLREQGKAAREFFTEWKTVYLDPCPLAP